MLMDECNIKYNELAETLGIDKSSLSRLMSKELNQKQRDRIMTAINSMSKTEQHKNDEVKCLFCCDDDEKHIPIAEGLSFGISSFLLDKEGGIDVTARFRDDNITIHVFEKSLSVCFSNGELLKTYIHYCPMCGRNLWNTNSIIRTGDNVGCP